MKIQSTEDLIQAIQNARSEVNSQQVVHIGRDGLGGNLLETLLEVPTENADMSFLTSP